MRIAWNKWLRLGLEWLVLLCFLAPTWADEGRLRVRFAPEKEYGPFIFLDEQGRLQGLSVDILQELAPEAGLQLDILPAAALGEILQRAQAGEVDLISSLRATPERAKYLGFTLPYVAIPAVLIGRSNDQETALDRLAGQRVAVGKGYAVEGFVREHYPQIQWVAVTDDTVALQQLARGEVRAVVADLASVIFIMRAQTEQNWRIEQNIGFQYQLSFAFAKDKPQIGERLNRALLSMPLARREAILSRWLDAKKIETEHPYRRILLWSAYFLLSLVVFGALGWVLRRRRGHG